MHVLFPNIFTYFQIYSNCSCLVSGNSTSTVSPDSCHYGCNKLYIVLAVLFVCLTLMSCIFIPIQTVILRLVCYVPRGTTYEGFSSQFFFDFLIKLFCFAVAICDLVHDMEAIKWIC